MRKKLLGALLCATMALTMFAACGKGGNETPTPTPTATPTAEPTPAGEALPEAKYYFSFDGTADGLVAKERNTSATLTTMAERVYTVDKTFNFTNGVKGQCLWLDGTFGAQIETLKPLESDTYTISFWMNANRLATNGTVLQFGSGMAQGVTEHWVSFTSTDAKTTFPGVWNKDLATSTYIWNPYEEGKIYGASEWAHIVLVCDETAATIDAAGALTLDAQFYVNGVACKTPVKVTAGAFSDEGDFAFLLGVNPWDTIYKGAIDELYIFDKALTPGQVKTLYAEGDTSKAPVNPVPDLPVVKDYSAQATTGMVIGNKDCTSAAGTAYSDIVEVPVNETVKVSFVHYVEAYEENSNFNDTFSVVLQNVAAGHSTADNADYKEYAVVSAAERNNTAISSYLVRSTLNKFNPKQFANDTDQATVTMTIKNNGGTTVDVTYAILGVDNTTRYVEYAGIPVDGPVYYSLTVNNCFIDIQGESEIKGEVIGSMECTTPFFSKFSDIKCLPAGESVRLHFTNYTSGLNNWNNFYVILQNMDNAHSNGVDSTVAPINPDYVEYAVLRADNWGWGTGFANPDTQKSCTWDWTTFTSDMKGADVVLDITNDGSVATVTATVTTKAGAVYTQKYTDIIVNGDIYYCLTVDNSWIEYHGERVGNSDNSTPFFTAFSEIECIPAGEEVTVHFTNHTNGVNNWNNFYVILQNMDNAHSNGVDGTAAPINPDYVEYAVLRADNWGWGTGFANLDTQKSCNWVWESFTKDMEGADVVLNIKNNGTAAEVTAVVTTKAGVVYTQKYTDIAVNGDIYWCLTVDSSWLDIHGTVVGTPDCLTPFFTQFSDIKALPAGETASLRFRNYTNGLNNWNNFYVILQNMDNAHSNGVDGTAAPINAAYVEYAVLRADNWGWGTGFANLDTQKTCNWVWETFTKDIQGALVELTITNDGSVATVKAEVTTVNGEVYTQEYKDIVVNGDIYYCLTVDGSYIDLFE